MGLLIYADWNMCQSACQFSAKHPSRLHLLLPGAAEVTDGLSRFREDMRQLRTLRLPSAMRRRRLQSPQKALVMLVTKLTVPRWPRTLKFFATSPRASCRRDYNH